MKKLYFIYAVLLLPAFTSCKKDAIQQTLSSPNKAPVIAAVSDSVSYMIDGITYTAGNYRFANQSSGSEDANRKLIYPDSTKKYEFSLVGGPDSIMYFQENAFYSTSASINIYFVKKFFRQQTPLYFPGLNTVLTMFAVGKYGLAEDFEWQNSQNGIAIDVVANNKAYSSYNAYNGLNTIVFPPGSQKNSTFGITSFVQTDGGYNLEAKFTAVIFDTNGQQKQLANGYLRMNFAPAYAINGY